MSDPLRPPLGDRDPAGMTARIEAAPDQIEAALASGADAPWQLAGVSPDLLAVGGLGGSAIAADLAASVWADRLPRPVLVVRDFDWPACVTPRSLALLSSYSGETGETLALYDAAAARGVPRAAITTGGALAARCARDRVPVAFLPKGSPPRAALYASWVALGRLLHALGWITDPAADWRAAAAHLRARNARWGPAAPEDGNDAKAAARALHGRFVFLYAGARLAPVVTRIRNQLNENAKLLGHSAVVPELGHNEIVGWERPGATAERSAVVILRDADDPVGVSRRLTLTAEFAAAAGARVIEVAADDGGALARMTTLVHWGDYVSVYLALLEGVDPTPIASIDTFKRRLAEPEERRVR